jgi:hypothetical protein
MFLRRLFLVLFCTRSLCVLIRSITFADTLDPDAFDPDAFDPDAFDPDAFDPDAFDPNSFDPNSFGSFGALRMDRKTKTHVLRRAHSSSS